MGHAFEQRFGPLGRKEPGNGCVDLGGAHARTHQGRSLLVGLPDQQTRAAHGLDFSGRPQFSGFAQHAHLRAARASVVSGYFAPATWSNTALARSNTSSTVPSPSIDFSSPRLP